MVELSIKLFLKYTVQGWHELTLPQRNCVCGETLFGEKKWKILQDCEKPPGWHLQSIRQNHFGLDMLMAEILIYFNM